MDISCIDCGRLSPTFAESQYFFRVNLRLLISFTLSMPVHGAVFFILSVGSPASESKWKSMGDNFPAFTVDFLQSQIEPELKSRVAFKAIAEKSRGNADLEPTIHASMNRPRQCTDNAHMESFFHSFKSEWIHGNKFKGEADLKMAIQQYIEGFYNPVRLHSGIGYQSPMALETAG